MKACKGCGAELPPPRGPGRERIWCSARCRKDTLYREPCEVCGVLVRADGTAPHRADGRRLCVPCAVDEATIWTRDAIICAIQDWAAEHDGEPPTAQDFDPGIVSAHLRPAWRARWEPGRWPHFSGIQKRFGTWNNAVRAAGFTPRGTGKRGKART